MNHQSSIVQKRVLLTGAAGGIGAAFLRAASERYRFRLADRDVAMMAKLVGEGEGKGDRYEIVALDVADLAACREACRDIDVVVHLAADANPEADFYGSLLQNNIQGVYNIFQAAYEQGCQRVITASSLQVQIGDPLDVQSQPEGPLRPMNMYGVSKCFAEAVASYFAHAKGLSSMVVRIGAYDVNGDEHNWLRQEKNPLILSGYVSERDMNQLLVRCIETPDIPFAVVYGISNNRFKRVNLESTRQLLGYAPQDDAFEIFRDELGEWLQG